MNIYNLYDHDLVAEPEAGGLRLRGEDQGAHDYAGGTAGVRGHTGVHGTRGKTGRCLCQIGEVVKSSVADLVQFFPDPVFQNPDPDPGDPKKTGSDRIRNPLRYVFDV